MTSPAQPASTKAVGAAGSVLLTLASGQFLMTLDSSVMNVSIATGRQGRRHDGHRHPDRDHALHAGDGDADDHRRQDRQHDRAAAGLRDRLRDLRRRLVHHRARAQPRRPDHRLVVPRGHRRGADHARHRRPRRLQLRAPTNGRGPTAWSPRPARSRSPPGRSSAGSSRRTSRGAWSSPARCVIVVVILVLHRARSATLRRAPRRKLDLVGAVLSAAGLGLAVFGVLRSGEWGWVQPKPGAPRCSGSRRRSWLILGGPAGRPAVLRVGAAAWSSAGRGAARRPGDARNAQLAAG